MDESRKTAKADPVAAGKELTAYLAENRQVITPVHTFGANEAYQYGLQNDFFSSENQSLVLQERASLCKQRQLEAERRRKKQLLEQRGQQLRNLHMVQNYRRALESYQDVACMLLKQKFALRRVIALVVFWRMAQQLIRKVTALRVAQLFKKTCFFLQLKMIILNKRRRTRKGSTFEKRFEIDVVHHRFNFVARCTYEASRARARLCILRFLLW